MIARLLSRSARIDWRFGRLDMPTRLGILFGILLPFAMAHIFATYVHELPSPWLERAKLLELPIVVGELLVVVWASRAGFEGKDAWAWLPFDVRAALALLLVALAVSSAASSMPIEAALQSMIVVVHLYCAAAVYFLARRSAPVETNGLLVGLAWGLPMLAVLTALRFGFPPPLSEVPGGKIEWDFALPGFISVRYFGTWTGAIAAALAVKILAGRVSGREWRRWQAFYVLAVGLTVWSGTRAAVLGGTVALTIFLIFQWRALERGALVRLMGLTLLGSAAAWALRFEHPFFHLINAGDGAGMEAFTAGRWSFWQATVEGWLRSPWIGHGTGSLFWTMDLGWKHTQPHNAVLQFLYSWGLIGAIPACWLLLRASFALLAAALKNPETWPLLAMVISLLAMSMVDGALYYPRFVAMIAIGMGLILAVTKSGGQRESAR